jgi:hypothetical protein
MARMPRTLSRLSISMPMGALRLAPSDAKEGGHVTAVGNASVDMLPTIRYSSTSQSFCGQARLSVRRSRGCLGPIASYMDGFVDLGVMVLADLSYTSGTMLTLGFPTDVRSTLSVRFLRAFQRLQPYLHRNVSYGVCENEITWVIHR